MSGRTRGCRRRAHRPLFPSATLRRASPQFLVAIAAPPRWPPTDDGDDESFAEGVRRAGSCDHRRSAAGGGTIRGGVVGVNIGAAFAVGVIGLLPPPPHYGKRRKAVAITAGASVGASSPLVPNYLRPERRTHALARSLAPETRKTRATATAVAAAAAVAARYGWVVARTHARSPLATAAARSVGRFFHPTSVRLSTGLHSSEWSSAVAER